MTHTLNSYYENVWVPSLRVRVPTQERYAIAMQRHVLPVLGRRKLDQIIAPDLDKLVYKLLDSGMAVSTVATTMGPIKALLSHACRQRVLSVNEGRLMAPLPKAPEPERRALSEPEVVTFFEAVDDSFRTLFRVLLGTGIRVSELIGLEARCVGADSLLIDKRWASEGADLPKNGKPRSVPLSEGLSAALRPLCDGREGTALVFPNPRGSHWADRSLSRVALEPARTAADLPWVGFHSFRHTYASRAWRHMPLGELSANLGHATPQFTWTQYVHLFDADRAPTAWVDALDPACS